MKALFVCLVLTLPVLATSAGAQAVAADVKAAPYTLDTPIKVLVADGRAKAILDRELPGLTSHAKYHLFKNMSLNALQPLSDGLITDERLKAVETALWALQQ